MRWRPVVWLQFPRPMGARATKPVATTKQMRRLDKIRFEY